MPDSIQATFGLNVSPFTQSLARAEAAANASATKITSTLNKVSMRPSAGGAVPINWQNVQAFNQRTLDFAQRRPYRTAQDFLPAPSGKYPTPEDEDTPAKRFRSPRGLGIGITVFAAASQLERFLSKAREDATKLEISVHNIAGITGSPAFFGREASISKLKEASETLSELFKRGRAEAGTNKLFGLPLGPAARIGRHIVTGTTGEEDAKQIADIKKGASQAITDLAFKQNRLNDAERISLGLSEEKAQLLKVEIEHMERLGEITRAEAATGINNPAARSAENQREALDRQRISREFDIRRRRTQIEHQELLDRRPGSGLTDTAQQGFSLAARLQELRRQIRISPREKAGELGNEALGVQNQIDALTLNEFRKSGSQRLNERISATRDKQDIENIRKSGGLFDVHRDMSGNIISGVNPLTGDRVKPGQTSDAMPQGPGGQSKGETDVVNAIRSLEGTMKRLLD